MHEETLARSGQQEETSSPFVRTGSRIKDLQGLFSQGSSSTRSSQVLGVRGQRNSPSPRSVTSRLDSTPHTKYALSTPPPVKHGFATPPLVKNGLGTPPLTKHGLATPPSVKHGLGTPPPIKSGLGTPSRIKNGLGTPPLIRNGQGTPPIIRNGLGSPPPPPPPLLNGQETLPTINGQDTLPNINGQDTLPIINGQDTLPTINGQDTLPTNNGQDTLPSIHGKDTLPIVNGQDTLPTINGQDTLPSLKNGLGSCDPIKPGLASPPAAARHLGTKEGGLLNGSVTVGGNSVNTSSSNRIRRKLSQDKDKKLPRNGLITSTLNYTNKERKLDGPDLVKNHIPVRIGSNEGQENQDVINSKQLQEENDDTNEDKEFNGAIDKHNNEDYVPSGREIEAMRQNSEDTKLQEVKHGESLEGDKLKDRQNKHKTDRSLEGDHFEERQNNNKTKDNLENKSSQLEEETLINMIDHNESKNHKITKNTKDIFTSLSQNKITNEIQNNTNKHPSLSADKSFCTKKENIPQNASKSKESDNSLKVKTARIHKPEGYVGFGSLPGQMCRKAVRKGFEFTLMVVGESGLGKSTLVNSMFLTDIYSSKFPGAVPQIPKTLNVETHKVLLEEGGVKLSLTVVDTPGFGDAVDNTGCWEPITNFVDQQYEEFLQAETRVNRVELPDTRVHVCLYFIAPSGHGLKPLDIEFMSRLHDKVNIIPVIGKADACSTEELQLFKQKILAQIADSKIHIYSFPDGDKDDVGWMRSRMPFAVVGSNTVIQEQGGKRVRGRKYPWGTVVIENKDHCDFLPLRDLLLAHHMQDLKDVTNYVHYENFRSRRLTEMFAKQEGRDVIPNKNPLAALEDETKEHTKKIEETMENMEEVFEKKVEGKVKKLKENENHLDEVLMKTKEKLEDEKRELERRKEEFLREKKIWENNNFVPVNDLRKKQSLESLLDGKKKKYGLGMMTFKIGRTKTDDF